MSHVVAIVQARMGSSRLPGKVLMDLAGETMLARVIQRLRIARSLDEIVVATSTHDGDDAVVREAGRHGVGVYRGSERDVLERYVGAARAFRAGVVVRVTADCPLLDPWVVDRVVTALANDVDYASNTHFRSYPRGLDVEALHRDTLERIDRLGTSAAAREHVTAFVVEQRALFRVAQVRAARDASDLRWTVDTPEDLEMVRSLYAGLDLASEVRPYEQLVDFVETRPDLARINAHVIQKPIHVA
jgi:spore coat polysaccharide biosynthesis protein SpsF